MPIWIEFRCANRNEPTADGRGYGEHCHSHNNAGPMDMADDTHADVVRTLRELKRHATAGKAPWVKSKNGWVCPFCAKALSLTPNVRKGVKMVTAAVLGSGGDDPGSREYWLRMTDEEKSFLQVSSYEEFSARYRVD